MQEKEFLKCTHSLHFPPFSKKFYFYAILKSLSWTQEKKELFELQQPQSD